MYSTDPTPTEMLVELRRLQLEILGPRTEADMASAKSKNKSKAKAHPNSLTSRLVSLSLIGVSSLTDLASATRGDLQAGRSGQAG